MTTLIYLHRYNLIMKMVSSNFLKKDETAIELPINIVVMLVVGMVDLAALLAIIPTQTKQMRVEVLNSTINIGAPSQTIFEGTAIIVDNYGDHTFSVALSVMDADGNPVQGASVALRGSGGVATGVTADDGTVTVASDSGSAIKLAQNQNEASMKLTVTADGIYDYEKDKAILLIKK